MNRPSPLISPLTEESSTEEKKHDSADHFESRVRVFPGALAAAAAAVDRRRRRRRHTGGFSNREDFCGAAPKETRVLLVLVRW